MCGLQALWRRKHLHFFHKAGWASKIHPVKYVRNRNIHNVTLSKLHISLFLPWLQMLVVCWRFKDRAERLNRGQMWHQGHRRTWTSPCTGFLPWAVSFRQGWLCPNLVGSDHSRLFASIISLFKFCLLMRICALLCKIIEEGWKWYNATFLLSPIYMQERSTISISMRMIL